MAYTGAAISLHEHDQEAVRLQAYSALQYELPSDDYQDIASGSSFRRDVAANSDHFSQQLRFYKIRPLYVCAVAILHAVRIGYVQATRLISAAAFFFLGLLLFIWAKSHVGERNAAIGVPLLLITPVIFTSARTGSPDAISALFVSFGTYYVVERRRMTLGVLLLLVSLFLRTDNLFFICLLFAWQALRARLNRPAAVALALLSIATVFAINRVEHSYSWPVLMENTASPVVSPAEISPAFKASDYFSAVSEMMDEASESSVVVFPFVAALALLSRRLTREWTGLITVVLLSWAAHIILFPHIEDRYFVAGSAIVGIGALSALLSSPSPQAVETS